MRGRKRWRHKNQHAQSNAEQHCRSAGLPPGIQRAGDFDEQRGQKDDTGEAEDGQRQVKDLPKQRDAARRQAWQHQLVVGYGHAYEQQQQNGLQQNGLQKNQGNAYVQFQAEQRPAQQGIGDVQRM